MGLLKIGRPLSWEESLEHLAYVREHGLLQFLRVWEEMKDMRKAELKWGEEIECGIFLVDPEKRTVKLSLRAPEIISLLEDKEAEYEDRFEGCTWQPEFGSWMVESTPKRPYTGYAADLLRVEGNMRLRRKRLLTVLRPNEVCPTMTAFLLMGASQDLTEPHHPPGGPISLSDALPDACINPHPRFGTLVRNIRTRRGSKVRMLAPLFRDKRTPEFVASTPKSPLTQKEDLEAEQGHWTLDGIESAPPGSPLRPGGMSSEGSVSEGIQAHTSVLADIDGESVPCVEMDAMAYGMGMCCLQVTFQARDVDESRFLYDQLAVLAPIMLALTAATPILKGRLVDTDVRWDIISGSVDCRTPAERGEVDPSTVKADPRMAGGGVRRLEKSRYSSISCYIYSCAEQPAANQVLDQYNDVPVEVDEEYQRLLESGGVDHILARHFAHLFVRDPLVIFDGSIEGVDDQTSTEHFENIQSTNWNTVRFKPPPPASPNEPRIGWRTEFRSMEIQLTDFENAAFSVFVVLLTRVILAFDLHLYLPLSKVDENMRRAHKRNSVLTEKFYFRKDMASGESDGSAPSHCFCSEVMQYEEMTIAEIMTGKSTYFPGLIPLCCAYLQHIRCDRETCRKLGKYLEFIRMRATGQLPTAAAWMRRFVSRHPDYNHDSVIPLPVAHDLVLECKAIGEGLKACAELLGDVKIDPIKTEEAYDVQLSSDRLVSADRQKVIQRYVCRSSWTQRRLRHRTSSGSTATGTDGASTYMPDAPSFLSDMSESSLTGSGGKGDCGCPTPNTPATPMTPLVGGDGGTA